MISIQSSRINWLLLAGIFSSLATSCADNNLNGMHASARLTEKDIIATSGFEGQVVSISFQALEAPQVLLPDVQIFNGKLYVKLSCEVWKKDEKLCQGKQSSYSLNDLRLALVTIPNEADFSSDAWYESLKNLDFAAVQPIQPAGATGEIEYGPLVPPAGFNGEEVGIIVRLAAMQEGQELHAYRIFAVRRAAP